MMRRDEVCPDADAQHVIHAMLVFQSKCDDHEAPS